MPRFGNNRKVVTIALLGIVIALTAGGWWVQVAPAADDDQSLGAFMRKKLDASSLILEGLTTENGVAIREGADALLEMSKAERWNVIADDDYREFNRDFLKAVQKLNAAAKAENYDNATLQWFDAVKGCVECHKYVRSQRPVTKS